MVSAEQPSDKEGQTILVSVILIQLLVHQLKVNYVNQVMYPVSVSDCPTIKCGLLGTLIDDLTSGMCPFIIYPSR